MDFRQELSELMKKDDKDSFWKLLRLLQQIVTSIDKNVDGKVANLSGKISKSEESAIALYRDIDSRLKDISNVCSDIIDARKLLANIILADW